MVARLCLRFLFFAGAVALARDPARLESRVDSKGSGEAVITNSKAVPLTAYLIQLFLEPCNPSPRPPVFSAFDAAQSLDEQPIAESQSRTESIGAAHCNKVGVSVPARAELKAVIYQDGSSFGERRWVKALLGSRRFQLEQIGTVLNKLARGAARDADPGWKADLETALASAQAKRPFPFPPVMDVRELALENLKARAGSSPPDQIARTTKLFEQLRSKLLSAKPPLR